MDYLWLLLGIACAGAGGECFIRGTVGLARWAGISAGIIGVTVAAFATSSPEMTVGISAALAGAPQLSLGDALGSNVVNIALVLGAALLLGDLRGARADIRRDYPAAVLAPLLLGLLALDGVLSQVDGIILLAVFLLWITLVSIDAIRQRSATAEVLGEHRHGAAVLYSVLGLALLIAAGRLIVTGATGLAEAWGLDAFVIGAVIVAIGTSMPELATTVIARVRGHDAIGLGTVLGSNIFNGLLIIGVVAVLHPIRIAWGEIAVALLFGAVTVAFTFPTPPGVIPRWRGAALLALYATYVAVTLLFR
ncbi:MAG: calcium/sodium antiporter [Armatimonadota bacterium]